ncbi:tgs domain-containing protein : Putative GTPase OS=Singulisphaera acidiphila (strain ATCC BAA-1392 / DSM 18658 / VKM B-2454 / MOB10) GN=Sinac_6637 PE=4 SV=1: MMR_HSR1: TGS [Gemmataceae bacterium]|nr:tgs domain-containing protein : Putative GTPase OS=Singulisphaera acidiphila (strain ATCC BAA-1392 / DSM 18658 / VKM B-2454 / MOB10) GN=Sinac_6637 PE=4 SV=1: MMR_HSR1: TGS [Gemmataceae bacterium]VTT97531.1 tgs domain-containing protein : Putative GTPase OS=Singulisphaera acidiphila (strain ATCC BAA-1392 / DSM 18658 / VKM B-2454 / MOB10) GN=Sinac_6637 PE=4 SV=1: MMR_HSR1: TGS [Gemmataceae bacterium]
MAVNLPPHYHDADARYKKAQTPEDKLAALKEMWVLLPKHKASEKVQAELKTKISELTDQIEQAKSGPKKAAPGTFKFPRQGAGQVVFLGPPNAGKSLLLTKLTKAAPAVAPYPFTTREPVPGMMDHEDVRVQLIDMPPVTADHYESFTTDVTRAADAAVLFLDLSDDDGPAATQAVVERLKVARRELVPPGNPPTDDPTTYALPTLLVANKCDDEAADIRLEIAREALGSTYPLHVVSAERGDGLAELRAALYGVLGVMRVYTKQPGKPADMTNPFTPPIGSTVADVAGRVHRDLEDAVKSARVWGTAVHDGQTVGRDHVLHDKDVVELHT